MRQVQFFIGQQAGQREVRGADDRCNGLEARKTSPAVVEETLGVQEAVGVRGPPARAVAVKRRSGLRPAAASVRKGFFRQITDQHLNEFGTRFAQAEVGSGFRFVTQ